MEHGKGLAVTVRKACRSFTQSDGSPGGAATRVCNVSTASSLTTGSLSASFSKCHDWVCFAVYAKELLGIFIACPEQLNADCRPSGSSYKKGRDIQEGGMAFGISVKLHSDICVSCSQPIDL